MQVTELGSLNQASTVNVCSIADAIEGLSISSAEERGAIFTKEEVVSFILDLIQYTPDRALYSLRLLEPCFGEGEFILAAVKRLIESVQLQKENAVSFELLKRSIRAVELHEESFVIAKDSIILVLREAGFSIEQSLQLVDSWLIRGDFLRVDFDGGFDFVIGNPPYVRQELIPEVLLAAYRSRYKTMYDRADLYVPFIERSLELLRKEGVLGFICADRWMKNKYGKKLRNLISENYNLRVYVDMVDTPAFHTQVSAYPAITIIANEKSGQTRIARRPEITSEALCALAKQILSGKTDTNEHVIERSALPSGFEPWIFDKTESLSLIRRIEDSFGNLEDVGCKIGIGVATGADAAFIGLFENLNVEPSRKLPLVMTKDIVGGDVKWRGFGVINPFSDEGGLVDLEEFPMLKKYLDSHKDQIKKRHIAKKSAKNWYRTIDRIYPSLANEPKLLIPDIKGAAHIVLEKGQYYPHHNLYYITSKEWDLRALQAVLKSGIAWLFVATYSTKMRGGYVRFQAQYLRRIRIPRWEDVSKDLRKKLILAGKNNDVLASNEAVAELYKLTKKEQKLLSSVGSNLK